MIKRHIIIDCPDRKGFINYINTTKFNFSEVSAVKVEMNKILVIVWEGLDIDVIDGALDKFGGQYYIAKKIFLDLPKKVK